jgi:hypothetical protein
VYVALSYYVALKAAGVCGLKLLVYVALTYRVCGVKLLVYVALSCWCMRPSATSVNCLELLVYEA